MTGRERMMTILKGGTPDRMAATLFIQGQGHFISQIRPDLDPWDFVELQKAVITYQRDLGLDVHARMLFFNKEDPLFFHFGFLNVQNETDNWKVRVEKEENGDTTLYKYEITTPEGILTQTFSINEMRTGTFMYACTEKPIENQKDLDIAMKFEPPVSDKSRKQMKINAGLVRDFAGDDGIVSAWSNGGLFNNISGLIDHNEVYSVFLTDPDFYDSLMKFAKKRVFSFTDALIDSGVDAVCVGGNVAGGFLGPQFFKDNVLEYEREYLEYIKSKNVPTIYHNCGQLMGLVDSYKVMGASNIEPFSPHPLGDGDLKMLLENFNNEFVVTGGVDQVNVIQKGTLDDVKKATLENIKNGKKFDRFILQSADFLEYGTPPENVETYANTVLNNINV